MSYSHAYFSHILNIFIAYNDCAKYNVVSIEQISKISLYQLVSKSCIPELNNENVHIPGLSWIWISMDKSMDISMNISMCG